MKKTLLTILALFLLVITTEAKEGKIKYGKYIIYEGEIENKIPQGMGRLIIGDASGKDWVFLSVYGKFNNNTIINAELSATEYNHLEFEGNLSFEPKGEKGKAIGMSFNLQNGILYHDDIEYLHRKLKSIKVKDLQISLTTSKEDKVWTFAFGPDAMPKAKFTGIIEGVPLPHNVDMFGYTSQKMIGLNADFTINDVLVNCDEEGRYVFTDGAYYVNNVMHLSNGDEVCMANNDWTGTMTYADGTRITKDDKDNITIIFKNGDEYNGTLKRVSLQNLAPRGSDRPDFKYYDGVLVTNGTPEKWIAGESYSKRHERLQGLMRDELVSQVEFGSMTEQEAIAREKELVAEEERLLAAMTAKMQEFSDDSLSAVNALYPETMLNIKGKKYSGFVTEQDIDGIIFSKKVILQLSVYFVSSTRCILSFTGKAKVQDGPTEDYLAALTPSFVNEGNYAYRIEGDDICLYDVTEYNRQPFTFKLTIGGMTCDEHSGLLKLAK